MRGFRRILAERFKNMNLTRKIMFIYVCVSAIPMLLLGMIILVQEKQTLREKELTSIGESLQQAVSQLNSSIMVYDNLSDYIAYNQPVTDVLTGHFSSKYELYEQYQKTVDPILSSPQYFSPDISALTIYVDRDIPAHGYTVAPVSLLEEQDWYPKVKGSIGPSVTWLISSKEKRCRSIRTMPLMEQNDERGLMYLEVNYDSFFSEFKSFCKKNQGLYIVDSTGNVLLAESKFDRGEQMVLPQELSKVSDLQENIKGYFLLQRNVPGTNWRVYLYGQQNFFAEQTPVVILFVLLFSSIVAATMLVAAYLFQKFVVKNIRLLAQNMQQVEAGDRTLRVVSDAKDEIGGLIRGFGSMLTEINRLIQQNYEGKLALRKSEMKALQAQINPHFLYNSLSLINWKAIEADEEDISSITLALSSLYRTSLNRGKNVLTVEKEIENVKSYLMIQSYMHDNSFDTIIDVDEEILQYETLNLLLQPLIENAIDHGIDLLEDGKGYIKIIGRQTQDTIVLTVEDNGVGIEPEVLSSILTYKSKGYGVQNINQRIELFYGKPFCLKIESERNKGTKCTVTIPKRNPSA
jgi:two-component system sensor histidine kinase YesM